ncbi:type VI secretion IcmF C-terminal domain-containing protein [Nannocystis sp. SCPEA4]|uniref:type VI secretion IcmF C-terminal domain-containing protein n=1 Tax=Nannocystis sp. SCPEA4 TaxID=2996787 RepID=UPI00226DEBBF|nr:type VI secretion IcmF C-terminal domain-containing protein [Nannocystis sp. SCPEA4]MCY1059590.1 hypothetical protein [Nannocystis sp. SCPEA4]
MRSARTVETVDAGGLVQAPVAPWMMLLLGLVVVALVVAAAWWLVAKRRRRASAAAPRPEAPLASRLSRVWRPFYDAIPGRARHYPTVVVFGPAGAGKTHAIDCHVDWRGQANQFRGSAQHDPALQLYLGVDVVVHEVSDLLLRSVTARARRSLQRLWRHMGPSATVVVVVDARTLLTTPPTTLRELAQLVRGKIGLFPRRLRASVDVRVYLGHLDQIEGYEAFAATVGADHPALDLDRLGPRLEAVDSVVAVFDAHLAHALTTRSAHEFDRMVRFYATLLELLRGLRPLLATLQGRDEPHGDQFRTSGLYLGALVPRSHVGRPFRIDPEQIASSIGRHHRRGLRTAGAILAGGAALLGALGGWHLLQIGHAQQLVDEFVARLAFDRAADKEAEKGREGARAATTSTAHDLACERLPSDERAPCTPFEIDDAELTAASDVTRAIEAMNGWESLFFAPAYVERKRAIEEKFQEALRTSYLYPQLACSGRLQLLYVMALLYATPGNDLGRIVRKNSELWSGQLGLTEWIIEYYVSANTDLSRVRPDESMLGEVSQYNWTTYVRTLREKLNADAISVEEAECLRHTPLLRSPDEYQALAGVILAFRLDDLLRGRFRQELLDDSITLWSSKQHDTLAKLDEAIDTRLRLVAADTKGWGFSELIAALSVEPPAIDRDFELEVDGEQVTIRGSELVALFARSRASLVIDQVLDGIERRSRDIPAFFDESDQPPRDVVIHGFGGGPTRPIGGYYTRKAFERHVAPVLRFAARQLGAESELRKERRLTAADAERLEHAIAAATEAYASAYRRELLEYYASFELDPPSEMTLPFVVKAFARRSSWFVEFLEAVSTNASLELPAEVEHFRPMARALAGFAPMIDLLREENGALPGLLPYQALIEKLQPTLTGAAPAPQGLELRQRLSPLGAATLEALQIPGVDHAEQIEQWLTAAGLDAEWHAPFLAPVLEARALGLVNIEAEVRRAWQDEVRPLVRPVLRSYPFDPSARVDVDVDELEALVRAQGKERGAFWTAFDRLIAPATLRKGGELTMLAELSAPPGMLAMVHDLERTSRALWDADGNRVPLNVSMTPQALPREPHEDRFATLAYLRSGGAAVYGFNQRPEPQALELRWWNQGSSVVALELRRGTGSAEPQTHTIEEDAPFSFYRLLDRAADARTGDARRSVTESAIRAATRCVPGESRRTRATSLVWRVPVAEEARVTRSVRMVIKSDPWTPFAVRDCE